MTRRSTRPYSGVIRDRSDVGDMFKAGDSVAVDAEI